jgi:hypothetical protein
MKLLVICVWTPAVHARAMTIPVMMTESTTMSTSAVPRRDRGIGAKAVLII